MATLTAPVLAQGAAGITFAVDEVTPAETPLACIPLRDQLSRCGRLPLLACSNSDTPVLKRGAVSFAHALIDAVCTAFSQHRPLCLRPDDIWLTIAQGFSHHVKNHAEELRHRFVRHDGQMELTVETESITQVQDWEAFIPQWSALIREQLLDPAIHDALVCDFTTTTPPIRFASQVVLLETFQCYFEYIVKIRCGIPTVTLCGTPEDWQTIRSRVAMLAQYDLEWWTSRLLPICDALIATSQGQPPHHFWQAIYATEDVYEGPAIKGWLADLFPYVRVEGEYCVHEEGKVRNPLFNTPPGEWHRREGLLPRRFPAGKSHVRVQVEDESGARTFYDLFGGFLGVAQHDETLTPEIGWGILQREAAENLLLEAKLDQRHTLRPYASKRANIRPGVDYRSYGLRIAAKCAYPDKFMLDASIDALYRHCDGGTLYDNTDHPWTFYSAQEAVLSTVDPALCTPYQCVGCFTFLALPDGRQIAVATLEDVPASKHPWREKPKLRILLGRPTQEIHERDPDDYFGEEFAELSYEEQELLMPMNADIFSMISPTFPIYHYAADTTRVLGDSLDEFFTQMRRAGGRYFFDA